MLLLAESMTTFTIHFATINTFKIANSFTDTDQFTIHFATINTQTFLCFLQVLPHLQYTLLLLIPSCSVVTVA